MKKSALKQKPDGSVGYLCILVAMLRYTRYHSAFIARRVVYIWKIGRLGGKEGNAEKAQEVRNLYLHVHAMIEFLCALLAGLEPS